MTEHKPAPYSASPPSNRRVPKGDKRARTRATLLEAARELIRERGYEQTTLQAIAQRAGMTVGAIYGNFKDRDALFMALAETHWAPIKPTFAENSTFVEKMQALARATIASIPDRRLAAGGRLAGMAYALKNDELRARIHDETAKSFHVGAAWVNDVSADHELGVSADVFVRVLHALTEGLLFQRFLTPELYPDEVFIAAFEMMANAQLRER